MKNLSALIVASFLASSPAIQADDNRQRLQQNSDRTASQSTADYLQELIEAQAYAPVFLGEEEVDETSIGSARSTSTCTMYRSCTIAACRGFSPAKSLTIDAGR